MHSPNPLPTQKNLFIWFFMESIVIIEKKESQPFSPQIY